MFTGHPLCPSQSPCFPPLHPHCSSALPHGSHVFCLRWRAIGFFLLLWECGDNHSEGCCTLQFTKHFPQSPLSILKQGWEGDRTIIIIFIWQMPQILGSKSGSSQVSSVLGQMELKLPPYSVNPECPQAGTPLSESHGASTYCQKEDLDIQRGELTCLWSHSLGQMASLFEPQLPHLWGGCRSLFLMGMLGRLIRSFCSHACPCRAYRKCPVSGRGIRMAGF